MKISKCWVKTFKKNAEKRLISSTIKSQDHVLQPIFLAKSDKALSLRLRLQFLVFRHGPPHLLQENYMFLLFL